MLTERDMTIAGVDRAPRRGPCEHVMTRFSIGRTRHPGACTTREFGLVRRHRYSTTTAGC